jgi:hypothetical protein
MKPRPLFRAAELLVTLGDVLDIGSPRGRRTPPSRVSPAHLHWFRWSRYDEFSGASLYACRCGVVRPGL